MKFTEIQKRIISSIFLAPIFITLSFLGGIYFYTLIFLIVLQALKEIQNLSYKSKFKIFNYLILISFAFSILFVRGESNIEFLVFLWIVFTIFLSDIGGYLFGKILKGKKLTKISPKKTIAGAIGSLIVSQFSIVATNTVNSLIKLSANNLNYEIKYIFITFIFSIICQSGDLFYSYQKRKSKIKDTGSVIPGHGGLLDRIDGMIFVFISALILKYFNLI